MKLNHFFSSVLFSVVLSVSSVSCGFSNENNNYHYVFLDLATLYGSFDGEEVHDVLRNASFGDRVELIEEINEYSKIKADGKEVYITTASLMSKDKFDVLKEAFSTNEQLKDKVYTPQGREALVLALQGYSNQINIIPSRPNPDDGYFIHYAFEITDSETKSREFILFGAKDMHSIPVRLWSSTIPYDADTVEEIAYINGDYTIR